MAINAPSRRFVTGRPGMHFPAILALLLALASLARGDGNSVGCVAYTNEVVPSVPWSIHVIKIDRTRQDVKFCTTLGGGKVLGMGVVSDQMKSVPATMGKPLAAINGDFYEKVKAYPGRPRDLQIRNGEVLSEPAGHMCFWMDQSNHPHMANVASRFQVLWPNGKATPYRMNMARTNGTVVLYTAVLGSSTLTEGGVEYVLEESPGHDWLPLRVGGTYTARVRRVNTLGNSPMDAQTAVLSIPIELERTVPMLKQGDLVRLTTETSPDLTGTDVAIGGGPSLVENGKVMEWKGWIHLPQPRTAMGWNQHYFYLVEVDGRQLDLSLGMTFTQLAKYMLDLGCEQAMNFDGGGSATLWAFGSVRNSPSEGQERAAPNALVVIKPNPTPGAAAK